MCKPVSVGWLDDFISGRLRTCWISFKDYALLESGQCGIVFNSSRAICRLHASFAGGDRGQILHVEHVSLVLLERQPVFLPEKMAAPSKPIPSILPT